MPASLAPIAAGIRRASRKTSDSVRIELDESAKELILREGFSEEYGARNLERVVDQMLGTLIAEALLGGKITAGQIIRLVMAEGKIQFHQASSP